MLWSVLSWGMQSFFKIAVPQQIIVPNMIHAMGKIKSTPKAGRVDMVVTNCMTGKSDA